MRFQINLDCTPEEAREFFGMPDVLPMQQAMMEELSRRMSEGIQTMDADTLMKTWVPAMFQGWTQMQQNWWGQMANAKASSAEPASEDGDTPPPRKKPR